MFEDKKNYLKELPRTPRQNRRTLGTKGEERDLSSDNDA